MKIAIVASSDRSFIRFFLPNYQFEELPVGFEGSPFIGTLINSLLENGHEVYAITISKAINNNYKIEYFKNGRFTWIVVPCRPHSFRFNGGKVGRIVNLYNYEIKQLAKVIKGVLPDIVHAHWSYEFAGAALKSKFPYLITVHDNSWKIFCYFKNLYRFGRFLMSEAFLRKARFASTVSPYMNQYVSSRCEVVKIIPNPTKIELSEDEVKKLIEEKIARISFPQIIMINNGWDERKNGTVGLQAFQIIKAKIPGASLHLFGDGTEVTGPASTDANKIQLKDVFFYGMVPHNTIKKHLSTAHILIHPSLEESFGVAIIEAMSYGIPAIGGAESGAVPWVIDNPLLLGDVKSAEDFGEKALHILSDRNKYSLTALNAYKNTLDRFSDKAVCKSYEDYYQDIIKSF